MALVGGAAAWPVAARAQQPGMPVVGFMSGRSAADSAHLVAAFREQNAEWTAAFGLQAERAGEFDGRTHQYTRGQRFTQQPRDRRGIEMLPEYLAQARADARNLAAHRGVGELEPLHRIAIAWLRLGTHDSPCCPLNW